MIRFRCSNCNKAIEAEPADAGKSADCPDCGTRLVVPPPATSKAAVPVPPPSAPPPVASGPADAQPGGDYGSKPHETIPGMPPLPPVAQPDADRKIYHVATGEGKRMGPFSLGELGRQLADGQLPSSALVWKIGDASWTPITDLHLSKERGIARGIADSVASMIGTETISGFNGRAILRGIFRKHTDAEMLDFYSAGSPATTPMLAAVMPVWPSPWIFSRVLLMSVILYFAFDWATTTFHNPKLLPGLMFAGNFAIPFSFLVLFAELNIRRNVPWFTVMRSLLGGGLLSLIFTLILNQLFNPSQAYWAGPIEETAKLLAVIFFARKGYLNGQILTGLLFGAAVGTGFAIFESAGYTFQSFMAMFIMAANGMIDPQFDPDATMQLRALLSPFCHVIWTAIAGGALWNAMRGKSFTVHVLYDAAFLRIAIVPVLLHMLWNSPLLTRNTSQTLLKYGVCGAVGWIVVLLLVNQGIAQVRAAQAAAGHKP
jgi:RsiW-degrading membrane proteinase PrsW (M82 family)